MELLLTKIKRVTYVKRYLPFNSFSIDKPKELKDERLAEKRRVFWEQETLREAVVKVEHLTPSELVIHLCHKEAVLKGHFTYDDPETKKREYTRLRHFLRGACCGNACRHCIYDHVKVPSGKIKTKRFNSSYWVYNETDADDINDNYMMSIRKPKLRRNPPQ